MKLIPLIDSRGVVKTWADRKTGWICNPTGRVFALIDFDGVFGLTGERVGWFYGDHIRNRNGQVVLSRLDVKIEVLTMPRPEKIPPSPKIHMPTGRPVPHWVLPPPYKGRTWADVESLFDGLSRVRGFEGRLRQLL
jgi:hypothetical protein